MKGIFKNLRPLALQFFSYFCVGGTAALVEWATFYLFCYLCTFGYGVSTALSFLVSTFVNFVLGRKWTFRKQSASGKSLKEAAAVYLVSGIGLGLNLLLMALFVDGAGIPEMLSKITATGLVFIWNFLSRKFWVYKV